MTNDMLIQEHNGRGWGTPALALVLSVPFYAAGAAELPELDCVIEPYEVVDVSSAIEGLIEKIYVERNDLVEKGQILAELESDVEKASLAFARVKAGLDSEIKLRRASLGFDQRSQTRLEELYAKKAIPLHVKDEADTDAMKSHWLHIKAQEDQRLAGIELTRAKAVLERKTVHSPIDGIVVARHKAAGEYVENQPILKLAQVHPLRVEVIAPVDLFGMIETGMTAEVIPELTADGTHSATVMTVDRVIDGASGTFDVRLEMPNPDYRIPSGLKCRLRLYPASGMPTVDSGITPSTESGPAPAGSITKSPGVSGSAPARSPTSQVNGAAPPEWSPGAGAAVCRALGPFENNDQAAKAALALAGHGVRVSQQRQIESVIDRYRVLAPRQRTPEETLQLQLRLRESGVEDVRMTSAGEYEGRVLLGVYSDKRTAERRRLELGELGFKTEMKPHVKQQPKIWIQVESPNEEFSEVGLLEAVARAQSEVDFGVAPCGRPMVDANGVAAR